MPYTGSLDKIFYGGRFSQDSNGKLWRISARDFHKNAVVITAEILGDTCVVSISEFTKNYSFFDKGSIDWKTPVVCECGSDKINWHMHSDYCPKYAKDQK